MTGSKIPFTGLQRQHADLRDELLEATDQVLRSGIFMNGERTHDLERWLAERNRCRYAITCHSGTSALECIAEFYATENGMPNPPRVLMPSLTYAATANAFIRSGWDVQFVDVDAQGIIDLETIDLNSSFQAMVLVGLYGASLRHIGSTAQWRRLVLNDTVIIEDAAQHWLADDCVRIGQASAISFDPMKNLPASGNGGAIVTNDQDLADFARAWRDNSKPHHHSTGTNSRMSEIDCAHVMVRARYIDQWQTRRSKIAHHYCLGLERSGLRSLIDGENILGHAFHKFVVDTNDRDQLQKKLWDKNIETRIHYARPLPEYHVFGQYQAPDILSRSTALSRRVLSLPIYPELSDTEVDTVIESIRS